MLGVAAKLLVALVVQHRREVATKKQPDESMHQPLRLLNLDRAIAARLGSGPEPMFSKLDSRCQDLGQPVLVGAAGGGEGHWCVTPPPMCVTFASQTSQT